MAKYIQSKIQTLCECYICHKPYTVGLDPHHVISGRGFRKLADEDGLWIWLCRECHSNIHDKGVAYGVTEQQLKAIGQQSYINAKAKEGYPKDVARELWFKRYGKFFDYEDGK